MTKLHWKRAFSKNGFNDRSSTRRSLQDLVRELEASAWVDDIPTYEQFRHCFIRHRDIPFDSLLIPPVERRPLARRRPHPVCAPVEACPADDVISSSDWSSRLRPRSRSHEAFGSPSAGPGERLFVPIATASARPCRAVLAVAEKSPLPVVALAARALPHSPKVAAPMSSPTETPAADKKKKPPPRA